MSTIKVDTYLTRGGASEIAIDKLKGASSAGSMTIVGEGGSTTTNLQQGLNKQWIDMNQSAASIGDSFNTTSITDIDAGDFNVTITNAYANINYAMGVSGTNVSNGNGLVSMQGVVPTTTVYRLAGYLTNGTNMDLSQVKAITAGELA